MFHNISPMVESVTGKSDGSEVYSHIIFISKNFSRKSKRAVLLRAMVCQFS